MEDLAVNLMYGRLQMAFTLGFHIIFACFGIVLPFLLLVTETLYYKTKNTVYDQLTKKWSLLTILLFAIGAVSGTILSFELGVLWPPFMAIMGPVAGLPFSIEAFAFFFEVVFLMLYYYGRHIISDKLRILSVLGVFLCAATSGIIVIAVNGWMNAPQGFTLDANGNAINIDVIEAMFNKAFITQAMHMIIGAFQSVAFFIAGIYALKLIKNRSCELSRKALTICVIIGGISSVLQLGAGDMIAKQVCKIQPIKCAAMEAMYESHDNGAPLRIGGIPIESEERVILDIEIPKALSILAHANPDAPMKGLKELTPDAKDRPPVTVVHFAFQIMVAIGSALIGLSILILGIYIWQKWLSPRLKNTKSISTLPDHGLLLWALVLCTPLGFIALEAGWIVTEVGRQPWIIYNIMRTADAITTAPVAYQFWIVLAIYALLTVALVFSLYSILFRHSKAVNK